MRWLLATVILLGVAGGAGGACTPAAVQRTAAPPGTAAPLGTATAERSAPTNDAVLARAFVAQAHDLQVEGAGTVLRILADDVDGDRHQRFILRLGSGQTLLVAHNIDVAPRVDDLAAGDAVAFSGVYDWNEEGGSIHWTHHDPDGTHPAGWLRHGGRTYQ